MIVFSSLITFLKFHENISTTFSLRKTPLQTHPCKDLSVGGGNTNTKYKIIKHLLHQAAIMNRVKRHGSCQNYFLSPNICRLRVTR